MAVASMFRAGAAALALAVSGCGSGETTAPTAFTVELDAEKDYFAPDWVSILATPRGGAEVELGKLDVTIRRRIEITVPAGVRGLVFRTTKNIEAKLPLAAGMGAGKGAGDDANKAESKRTIVVRPLSNAGSASGIAWMLVRRGGITLEKLVVEWVEP